MVPGRAYLYKGVLEGILGFYFVAKFIDKAVKAQALAIV
jgi:hypothetical protein